MKRIEWEDPADEAKHYSSMSEFICPYCGYVHKVDHTEFIPDDLEWETEYDCDKCGRTYIVEQTVIVSHQTYKCKEETN